MNKHHCAYVLRDKSRAATCAGLSLALSLTLSPVALPAYAEDAMPASSVAQTATESLLAVRGIDTLAIGGDTFDVATAVGLGGSTLYADVSVGGAVRQHDLPYAFDNADDQAGVVSLNVKAGYVASHSGKISLDFYQAATVDREGAAPVLSATVYAVAMKVDGAPLGSVADSMVGIRTAAIGDETQPFEAPRLIVRGNETYRLVGGAAASPVLEDGVLYVNYEKVQAQGVSASVAYVDDTGAVIARDELGALGADEAQTVAVRDAVEANGRVYIPVSKMPTVTVSGASPEVTIHCMPRREQSAEVQTVNISYVSAAGAPLMRDKVDVGVGGYKYAPPTVFSQARDGSIDRYVLAGARDNRGNVYTAEQAAALSFSLNGAPEYTLEYEPENAQLTYTVNIALVSPTDDGRMAVETVTAQTVQVSEGAPATLELPATYEQDGQAYTRFGSEGALTYSWKDFEAGRMASDTVYYTRGDVELPAAYDVNVRYVDVVSGAEIGGETLTCSPDGQPLEVAGPETVEADGASYARLTGQEAAITHRFFAPYRTYTIYYAQPGALINGDVTVVRIDVVDGGVLTYYIDSATGTVSSDDGAGGLAVGAQYATLVTADGSADGAVAAAQQSDVTTPEGTSAYEERIADDETPLARASEGGSEAVSASALPAWWPAVLTAVAAAAAAGIAFFMRGRKRKAESESSSDEVKGA